MKKKFFVILKYLFFLALGFFLVWWQFDKMTAVQRQQFSDSLQHANYWLLFPVVIMALLSHISRSIRWKILIEPMGYHPSTKNTFYAVMTGYLVNTFIPRGGEIVKCSLLSKYERIPLIKLVGTILVERAFDLVCYFLLVILTILVQIRRVSSFIKQKLAELSDTRHGTPIWAKVLLFILALILLYYILRWVFAKFSHHKYVINIKGFHLGIREGFNTLINLKKRERFVAHTIFIWMMYLLQIYIGFSALSATANLGIVQACTVLSLATLGMIISPGGIGAFPLAVQEVLLIYNIDNVSFGWLIWGVSTAIIIVAGLISFGLLVHQNKNPNEAKS
jgi:uncharacterized protein (TIRG00374 family)